MRRSKLLADILLFLCVLIGFAFIHSCFYEMDIDTPADPRLSLTCTTWQTVEQLRIPDLRPTGSSLTYCKEYSYE
jgi:hypothetical protein